MSEDPKGFDAGDYNLFRYVHNDPLDLTDPMGLAGVEPQPGDHPLPGPVATQSSPFGSNIPMRMPMPDASAVDASARLSQSASLGNNDKIGLNITTGVASPNQSIGNPVPKLNTVTVTLYSATAINNHIGVGVNTVAPSVSPGLGLLPAPTWGFYPPPSATGSQLVRGRSFPGHMQRDTQNVIASHSIPISPTQAYLGSRNQNQVSNHPGNYNLYGRNGGNNCVITGGNTLRAIGIPAPTQGRASWVPTPFFDSIFGGH
jgi:hypothetical protein